MSGIIQLRDTVREFLRKYDEIVTPLLRFIYAYVIFHCISVKYGYSGLFSQTTVILLLSVICALVSDVLMVLIASCVLVANAFCVSVETAAVFLVVFIVMYCVYVRMFPKCAYLLMVVPVLCIFNLQYAVPIVVVIFTGLPGIVPAAFGLIIHEMSIFAANVQKELTAESIDENFSVHKYAIEFAKSSKWLIGEIVVFAAVIMIATIIYKLSIDYAWFIAIGAAALMNILFSMVISGSIEGSASLGTVFVGSLLGAIVACIIQCLKSMVDYAKKEHVQFEDDDYYYYVKAIPKVSSKSNLRKVSAANLSSNEAKERFDNRNVARESAPAKKEMNRNDNQPSNNRGANNRTNNNRANNNRSNNNKRK